MPVDLQTADALDALALTIFDLHIIPPAPGSALGYTTSGPPTGIKGADPAIDQQIYTLLAPVMAAIENRVLESAPYTLNVTMALKARKKKWFLRGLEELNSLQPFPVSAAFEYEASPGMVQGGNNSGGFTLAAAVCAAQLKIWANVIRQAVAPTWKAVDGWSTAPLQIGGFAQNVNSGIIFSVVDCIIDEEPAYRGLKLWQVRFAYDASGNFPINDTYETTVVVQFNDGDLFGVSPVVPPPISLQRIDSGQPVL